MDRQFLKSLELEGDTIDKIIDEHHSSNNSLKEQLSTKKDEVKNLKSERDELKDKVRDTQDNEDTINALRSKYDEAKNKIDEYEKKLQNNELDKRIISNVQDAHDVDDVLNFVDRSKFEYDDDGNINNFEDVLNEIREKKPHYFNVQNPTGNNEGNGEGDGGTDDNSNGGTNNEGNGGTNDGKPNGVNYSTGKPNGSGKPGSTNYEALGQKWAERLGGKK